MKNDAERLKTLYAQMTDGELEHLALDVGALNDVATPLLEAEISRRGLGRETKVLPVSVDLLDPADLDLVPLTQARTLDDLSDLRDLLDEAGIPSFLGPSSVPGWIGVSVRKEDQERAALVIEQAAQVNPDEAEAVGDYEMCCPECGSLDILHVGQDNEAEFHWKCEVCQHEWKDEALEA